VAEGTDAGVDGALGSLAALRAGLDDGRWTPTDVVEAVIARRADPPPSAWIDLVPADDLRAAAARLEREGRRDRPLWGLPFAVKGNVDVAGLPTTAGFPGFAAGPAERHATVVERWVAAGALPVGTTNLDQFATGLVGTRSPHGACHAHGHPGWISGGSSSGSAVVVAAGDVPLAVATDTAGSGRVPAALNGIAAVKPTRGRLSTAGVVPACRSLDCVAVFAATVAEAAVAAAVADGPDPGDPWSRPAPAGSGWWRPLGRAPRVAVSRDADRAFAGDPLAGAADDGARTRMQDLGWDVVEVDLAPFLAAGALLYGGGFVAERYASVGAAIDAAVESGGDRLRDLDPVVASIVLASGEIPAWQAFADVDRLRSLAAEVAPVWSAVDALALPVVPTTFTHAQVAEDPVGTNAVLGTYTAFANLLDLCAAVAPVGRRADGHPWGVQLLGPAFADGIVAPLAAELSTVPSPGRPFVPPGLPDGLVPLAVAGAHLRGEALEHEVLAHGAVHVGTTRTAPCYRLHLLSSAPLRPGLVRVPPPSPSPATGGAAIEVDVWALPPEGWAAFVARGVDQLAVGRIELADGTVVPGFVAAAADGSHPDLTSFGGWRAWRAAGAPL
jgi:allophanate hydrolase